MSMVEARRDEIAKRYGGVLFDLAQKNKALKTITKDAELLTDCIEIAPNDWRQVVGPVVSLQSQSDVMHKLSSKLKLGSLMTRFLMILCQNRRLKSLQSILMDFKARTQEAEGLIEGVIETATKISKKEIDSLQSSLKKQLGKDVSLHQELNEKLLGGIVLRIGSIMVDASLESQLNKLRQVMKG